MLIASFARSYSAHTHHRLLSFSPPLPPLHPSHHSSNFFLISHAPIPIFARVTLGRNLTESKPMMHLLSMKGKNVLPFEKLPSRFTIYVISLVPNAVTYLLITVSSIFMVSFPHSRSLLIFSLSHSLCRFRSGQTPLHLYLPFRFPSSYFAILSCDSRINKYLLFFSLFLFLYFSKKKSFPDDYLRRNREK